ncbi:DHBP synthase RibB-like alpha/beta domain-containing protein [Kockiozyma suomiensis]|uniref:DHBP synthase RibB-like alpha/beta domain-containing protein n=1 Tax=Kockiozyma suomiensis TaxID=1337062 RepID=UPI003343C6CB
MAALYETKVLPVHVKDIAFPATADLPEIVPGSETEININRAADILRTHTAPVAFPTETVYGLGASALDTRAVRQIFAAKNRPSDNPLIVHISSVSQLDRVLKSKVLAIYEKLIAKFWPGPLTIILPLPSNPDSDEPVISRACTPGQATFGVRMPAHIVARALIAVSDTPLAAPSANASTKPSPTTAAHVYADMHGRIPIILDGGNCEVGVESTVVDGTVSPPAVLRPGGVSVEMIREFGGEEWRDVVVGKSEAGKDESVRTPGMKYRHYSPQAKVVVFVGTGDGSEVVNAYLRNNTSRKIALLKSRQFDIEKWDTSISTQISFIKELGATGAEIARNLFSGLRDADERLLKDSANEGEPLIIVEGVSDADEGAAIMNRLRKAASEIYENGVLIVKDSH